MLLVIARDEARLYGRKEEPKGRKMGVQLNIKDEETVRLARELAAELGESVTQAVRIALQERRARTTPPRRRATVDEIMAIVRGARGHLKPEFRDQELSLTHGDLLYNEDGSFK